MRLKAKKKYTLRMIKHNLKSKIYDGCELDSPGVEVEVGVEVVVAEVEVAEVAVIGFW